MPPVPHYEPESERRIEAAVRSWITETEPGDFIYDRFRAALDAADEVVPVASESEMQRRSRIDHEATEREHARAERAEATARDLANALGEIIVSSPKRHVDIAYEARLRRPSFSGEEGNEQ